MCSVRKSLRDQIDQGSLLFFVREGGVSVRQEIFAEEERDGILAECNQAAHTLGVLVGMLRVRCPHPLVIPTAK